MLRLLILLCLFSLPVLAQDSASTAAWFDALEPGEAPLGERWYGFYFGTRNSGHLHFRVQASETGYTVAVLGALELGDESESIDQTLELDAQLRLVRSERTTIKGERVETRTIVVEPEGLRVTETDGSARLVRLTRPPCAGNVHILLLIEAHGAEAGALALSRLDNGSLLNVDVTFPGPSGSGRGPSSVRVDEGSAQLSFELDPQGRVGRFGHTPQIGFVRAATEGLARADLGATPAIAPGSAQQAVADLLYGLLGDDARYDRAADWPRLTESRYRAYWAARGITPTGAQLRGVRHPNKVQAYKVELREARSELNADVVDKTLETLTAEVDGDRATVTEAGGIGYVLERVDGTWKIVAFIDP